jgi:glycosyltransferase involved in cell wall biosynthesis
MKSVCVIVQQDYAFDIRVRRKAEALVAAGYSVDALALRGLKNEKTYVLRGVNVRTISLGKKRGSLFRYAFEYVAFFLWVLLRVTVQMRRRHYAIIDVNTLPDFLVFVGIFARWMGAKIVLDMHEITPEFYMSKYGIGEDSPWIHLLKYLEKISLDFADQVITINEPIHQLFLSRGMAEGKCTIITNSADESRFTTHQGLSFPGPTPDKFVMMYHGTLTSLYGLDIAIEALALGCKDMPEAELWILGSGPEQDALGELARARGLESKVKLIGLVPPNEVESWLNRCDAGLLPIRRDVFLDFASPNKLPEYIVMGKPVIISKLKAIRYYFSADALAYFEPNDPADLARQMIRLYRDPALRRRFATRAREEYRPIRWDVMKDRYLALITKLIGPAREELQRSSAAASVSLS